MPLFSNPAAGDEMPPHADNFIPVIPVTEASLLHSTDTPFCYDEACSCHQDEATRSQVLAYVLDGLMTPYEAQLFVWGKTL